MLVEPGASFSCVYACGLAHPIARHDLFAVPVALLQIQSTDLGIVYSRSVDARIGFFQAILLAVYAPAGWILHTERLPDFFFPILRDGFTFQRALEHQTQSLRVAAGIFETFPHFGFD